MSRAKLTATLEVTIKQAFGAGATLGPINWGDSHRRMLLWNRRFERAHRRSLRNQPPRSAR